MPTSSPRTYRAQLEAQQWLVFQAAHVGPMFGQFGHFHVFAKGKRPTLQRRTRRLLGVLNQRLKDHEYLLGKDYSIVDMAHVPWVECLAGFYKSYEHLGMGEFEHVERWRAKVTARPGYQRGVKVCAV